MNSEVFLSCNPG